MTRPARHPFPLGETIYLCLSIAIIDQYEANGVGSEAAALRAQRDAREILERRYGPTPARVYVDHSGRRGVTQRALQRVS